MLLKRLIIYKKKDNDIIRDISFNEEGLNLIVDLENKGIGSSIGKTTFVRCINICLGSKSIKEIYHSAETSDNEVVKKFILDNEVSVILLVRNDDGKELKLERCLYATKLQYINNVLYEDIEEYKSILKKEFFPDAPSSLKFRELITKFIRIDKGMNYIFKYNDGFGKNNVYHNAFYYFLNLYVDEQETQLNLELSELTTNNSKIKNKYKFKNQNDFKKLIDNYISELNEKKQQIKENDYVAEFEKTDTSNETMINELDSLTTMLYMKRNRVAVLDDRLKKEKRNLLEVDLDSLKMLYDDAIGNIKNLNKSFDDLVKFHNDMCNIRIDNYTKEIDILNNEISSLEEELNNVRKDFSSKFVDYKITVNDKSGSMYDEYINKRIECDKAREDYDRYLKNLSRIEEIGQALVDIKNRKNSDTKNKDLFSEIFNYYCKGIIKEDYKIEYNDNIEKFPLRSTGSKGQLGAGEKKSTIAALDFALIDFFNKVGKRGPRFVIHDQMENATLEELKAIFIECRKNRVQYILPILSDRISTFDITDEEILLKLSKEDKLLKI